MYITGVIAIILCFFIPYFYKTLNSTIKTILIVLFFISLISCVFIMFYDFLSAILPYAFEGIKNMIQGTNNSVNTRVEQLDWAISNNNLILFGNGIGKGAIMLESFYSLYYYRYGLVGIIIYMGLLIVTSYKSFKIGQIESHLNNDNISLFYYGLSIFYIVAPIGLLSSCHQDTPKISLIFYGFMGLIFNKINSYKNNRL